MASDGKTFQLWIPPKNKVIEGTNTEPKHAFGERFRKHAAIHICRFAADPEDRAGRFVAGNDGQSDGGESEDEESWSSSPNTW